DLKELAGRIAVDSKKYFAVEDPFRPDKYLDSLRSEFLEDIADLQKISRAKSVHIANQKLAEALNNYWDVFNRMKQQMKELKQTLDPDELPPDLTIAIDHLEAQADVVHETIKGAMKEQVAAAFKTGQRAEQISWVAGLLSLVLGLIVATLIV